MPRCAVLRRCALGKAFASDGGDLGRPVSARRDRQYSDGEAWKSDTCRAIVNNAAAAMRTESEGPRYDHGPTLTLPLLDAEPALRLRAVAGIEGWATGIEILNCAQTCGEGWGERCASSVGAYVRLDPNYERDPQGLNPAVY